jgi:hypothetical protein
VALVGGWREIEIQNRKNEVKQSIAASLVSNTNSCTISHIFASLISAEDGSAQ